MICNEDIIQAVRDRKITSIFTGKDYNLELEAMLNYVKNMTLSIYVTVRLKSTLDRKP